MAELEGQNPGGAGLVFAAHNNYRAGFGVSFEQEDGDTLGG